MLHRAFLLCIAFCSDGQYLVVGTACRQSYGGSGLRQRTHVLIRLLPSIVICFHLVLCLTHSIFGVMLTAQNAVESSKF